MLIIGEIEPGIRIGNLRIGAMKEELLSQIEDKYTVWERGDGFSIYTFDNYKLWFDVDGSLQQIGVTDGFKGSYKSVHIGTTMKEIKTDFGDYENENDEYEISGIKGLCFELGDMDDCDDWDELEAPIEWIFVYKC
ncbi:hypothetical protein SAMN02910451_00611 [Butyrivibrio hungatei]|uniref:Uncharacterized protein n=1 Tax=Butyrivibrio hungatei TaxID=185008 RepID=A0A1G5BA74_9FIRM|nr:hypothetical protein [Butyrivibrio hungatei]SCX87019.1 hypothetical protein SAMN02910451_00611 [Butyrivibrio hungatei]